MLGLGQNSEFLCSTANLSYVPAEDHLLSQLPWPTGAGYFELCGAVMRTMASEPAAAELGLITSVAIPAPLLLPAAGQLSVLVIRCDVMPSTGSMEIASAGANGSHVVHVTAVARLVRSAANTAVAFQPGSRCCKKNAALLAKTTEPASSPAALAVLEAPPERSGLWLDPATFDCFLQLGQVFVSSDGAKVYVPAGLGALRVAPAAATLRATAAAAPSSASTSAWAATLPLPTEDGTMCSDFVLAATTDSASLCARVLTRPDRAAAASERGCAAMNGISALPKVCTCTVAPVGASRKARWTAAVAEAAAAAGTSPEPRGRRHKVVAATPSSVLSQPTAAAASAACQCTS